MREAIPPLPRYAFALLKHRDNLTFTFYLCRVIPYCIQNKFILETKYGLWEGMTKEEHKLHTRDFLDRHLW
jgi:hypothetical protein